MVMADQEVHPKPDQLLVPIGKTDLSLPKTDKPRIRIKKRGPDHGPIRKTKKFRSWHV